jgi:hypothetical protein
VSNERKGLLLSLLGCLASAFYLTSYKVAAGLGDTKDAVFVMMVSAAVLNSLTSTLQSHGQAPFPIDRKSILIFTQRAASSSPGKRISRAPPKWPGGLSADVPNARGPDPPES